MTDFTLSNARRFYLPTGGVPGRLRCQWVKHLKTMSLNNMEIESLREYAARSGEIFIREVSNKNFPGKGKEKEDIKRDLLQKYTSNARYGKFYGNTELIRDKI